MTNQDYKNAALSALKGKWAQAVLATVVIVLFEVFCLSFSMLPQAFTTSAKATLLFAAVSDVLVFILFYPLSFGYAGASRLLLVNGDDQMLHNMVSGTFSRYFRVLGGALLMFVMIFLWFLLFIIPGLVMSFAYAMTPFLLLEFPEMSIPDAIRTSRDMMKGHKFDLFYLSLSFIGWIILGILTLGIGLLWAIPYMETSTAAFYEDVKAQYRSRMKEASAGPQAE